MWCMCILQKVSSTCTILNTLVVLYNRHITLCTKRKMASSTTNHAFFHPLLCNLLILLLNIHVSAGCYERIFSFGDSLADTGNIPYLFGADSPNPVLRPPYGQTHFHRATGRFSDGRLIIDFISEELGLPYVNPYLAGRTADDFKYGTNFAVGGATALSPEYFQGKGVEMEDKVYLGTQMDWFKDSLNLICPSNQSYCKGVMEKSLFLVGEIGGNDYNIPFLRGVPFEKIKTFVPSVISAISSAITELIGLGARTLVVPGNLPIGCVPKYLTVFKSTSKEDYEPHSGCLKWMNDFSKYHNNLLIQELDKLRRNYSNVTIIYADYFEAAMEIFLDPARFGFKNALIACCGGEGVKCGTAGHKVCDDPLKYASWDGFHPSEATYKGIAYGLLKGSHAYPPITSPCHLDDFSSVTDYIALYG